MNIQAQTSGKHISIESDPLEIAFGFEGNKLVITCEVNTVDNVGYVVATEEQARNILAALHSWIEQIERK